MPLELYHIDFGFSQGNLLLKDLSLQLEPGRIYALMGDNGSGKTTLFNLISGFHSLQSGDVFFKGSEINRLTPFKRNKLGIGRTFQDLRLINNLSVKENVLLAMQGNPTDKWENALLPARLFKTILNEHQKKCDEIIKEYFLSDVQDSKAGEISYGQQKLLNLACCVANGAELLLLDEPVAGVNAVYKAQLTILLKNLRQQGKTILLIEHDTHFIKETAERFLYLGQGILKEYSEWQPEIFEPVIIVATRERKQDKKEPLLIIEHLSAGYGKKQVLFDVSLEVNKGEMVLLTGGNGSGKSTLLKAVYGGLASRDFGDTAARIIYDGKDISKTKTHELIKIGLVYVPQKNNIFDQMTVKENLEVAGHHFSPGLRKTRIDEVFNWLPSLVATRHRTPFHFSGGEKQLLALGMALMMQPKLILLDEPGTGLSTVNIMKKLKLLQTLNAKDMTLLIIEHKVKEFAGTAHRILEMKLGKIKS